MQYNTSEHRLSHHQLPVNVDIDVEFTHENPAFPHQDPTMKPWGKLPWFFHISWPQLPSVSLSWAQWIGPPGHTCHGHGRSCVPFETSLYQSVDSIMSYVHFMSISCLFHVYPLVNCHITMEHHHCSWEHHHFLMGKPTISMAVFNSYV